MDNWIPVKERLPELVNDYDNGIDYPLNVEVIAWMPLITLIMVNKRQVRSIANCLMQKTSKTI